MNLPYALRSGGRKRSLLVVTAALLAGISYQGLAQTSGRQTPTSDFGQTFSPDTLEAALKKAVPDKALLQTKGWPWDRTEGALNNYWLGQSKALAPLMSTALRGAGRFERMLMRDEKVLAWGLAGAVPDVVTGAPYSYGPYMRDYGNWGQMAGLLGPSVQQMAAPDLTGLGFSEVFSPGALSLALRKVAPDLPAFHNGWFGQSQALAPLMSKAISQSWEQASDRQKYLLMEPAQLAVELREAVPADSLDRRIVRNQGNWMRLAGYLQPFNPAPPALPAYAESGRPGDQDSWKTPEFKAQWGLGAMHADAAYALGITGESVKVGVLDTGTLGTHPKFDGPGKFISLHVQGTRAIDAPSGNEWLVLDPPDKAGERFDLYGDVPVVVSEHGTHTGGIIAANRDGGLMHGVAYGASLVAGNGLELGPASGTFADFDAGIYKATMDGFVQEGVHIINNSWGISPNAKGANTGNSPNTMADIVRQYTTDTEKASLNVAADGALKHDILQVFAAGNDGAKSRPDAMSGLPYFRPGLERHWLAVVNLANADKDGWGMPNDAIPGEPDLYVSNSSTHCGYSKAFCVSAPGTMIRSAYWQNYSQYITPYQAAAAKPEDQRTDEDKSLIQTFAGYARYIDPGRKTWLVPTIESATGTSMAAPHAAGAAALVMQRFPFMTVEQVHDVVLTTSRYLQDGLLGESSFDALNKVGQPTRIPNERTGWGIIDLVVAMNGPGQLTRTETYTLPAGTKAVFSNDISDDWIKRLSGIEDPEEQKAWEKEKQQKGWTAGLPAGASDVERSEYEYQIAREQARLSRPKEGGLVKEGGGLLTLAEKHTYSYSGATVVRGGLLNVDGTLTASRAVVEPDGTLGGTGTAHGLWVQAGGVVAPGHSVGTLHSDSQGVQLDPGSLYRVEVNGTGGDRIETAGRANLAGFLTLSREHDIVPLSLVEVRSLLGQSYTVLTAADGIDGRFNESRLPQGAFIGAWLNYGPTTVTASLGRNGLSFADAGRTRNQRLAGRAVETLGAGNPVFEALLLSDTVETARLAETQLSGEIHADVVEQALEDGRLVRDAVLGRMRDRPADADRVWLKALGGFGESDGDSNAAGVRREVAGFIAGADKAIDDTWLLGATAGFADTDLRTNSLGSAEIKGYHLGLYGQGRFGALSVRLGGSYGFLDASTKRSVSFPGFRDRLKADSDARQAQLFGEVAYTLSWDAGTLEPFAGLSWTHVDADGFRERGGEAALKAGARSYDRGQSTLGMRASAELRLEAATVTPSLTLGWRHTYGEVTPDRDLRFAAASSSGSFVASGVPANRDSLLVEAGFDAEVSGGLSLGLGYQGDLGEQARDHAFFAKLGLRF